MRKVERRACLSPDKGGGWEVASVRIGESCRIARRDEFDATRTPVCESDWSEGAGFA